MKLQIEKAVYGGSMIAHQTEGDGAGRAVFVPFTLPGETIDAHLVEQSESFGEASLNRVLTSSKDRVQPRCAHFGSCGGCNYQHARYPAQVQIKIDILQETLHRAALTSLPEIKAVTGDPWAYRNRTRLRIAELEGLLQVGYNRRGSNDFLPIRECPILAPLLWRAAEALLQIAAQASPSSQWISNALEVEFFTGPDESKLQMTLFVAKQQSGFSKLCDQMQKLVPELTGADASLMSTKGPQRRTPSTRQLETWGAPGLSYRVADQDYWVSRGGFFQVNRSLVDGLVRIATEGRGGDLAWDLYAGVGLFSRVLARSFKQVVAVETVATDLSNSFKGPGKHAVAATTVEFLRSAVVQRARPELIVMDPPRAGVGAEVCTLLARIAAPEIVYVSCDPVTLARDLKSLTDAGYKIAELHMVDMFPQTFHLETVAVLRR
jgi:23S rRNA (uracil1939-C5)-methyltransferase